MSVAGLLSTTNPFAKRQRVFFPPLTRAIVVTDFPLCDLFICGYFNCVLLLYLVHFYLGTQTVGQAFIICTFLFANPISESNYIWSFYFKETVKETFCK